MSDLDAALEQYREQGYARLPGVATEDALAELRARADAIMLGEVPHEPFFFQHDVTTGRYEDLAFGKGWEGPSRNYRKIEKLERDPVFARWLGRALFHEVARALVGEDVVLYRAILMSKAARGGTVLPWHQDGGALWGLERDPELQIWTALDDCPEEAGCVEVVPGSHQSGLATPLGGMIPEALHRAARADERKVALPARAGDVLLLHNHVWHTSGVNRSDHARRAFSVCYMPASTRCLRKKRAPRVFPRVAWESLSLSWELDRGVVASAREDPS